MCVCDVATDARCYLTSFNRCCAFLPQDRASIAELLEHPFLANQRKQSTQSDDDYLLELHPHCSSTSGQSIVDRRLSHHPPLYVDTTTPLQADDLEETIALDSSPQSLLVTPSQLLTSPEEISTGSAARLLLNRRRPSKQPTTVAASSPPSDETGSSDAPTPKVMLSKHKEPRSEVTSTASPLPNTALTLEDNVRLTSRPRARGGKRQHSQPTQKHELASIKATSPSEGSASSESSSGKPAALSSSPAISADYRIVESQQMEDSAGLERPKAPITGEWLGLQNGTDTDWISTRG